MIVTDTGMVSPETAADRYVLGNIIYASAADSRWPISVRLAVKAERVALLDALELYEALENGQIHETSEYPELAGHPEARHEALELTGQAIADLMNELVEVFPACRQISNEEGEWAA